MSLPDHPGPDDLAAVEAIVRRAGALIMAIYGTDFAVRGKSDASPVTEADEQAEALIVPALAALAPGVPIVAEEAVAAGRTPAAHAAKSPSRRFRISCWA